ncbi:MAG TPA: SDR family oxidoreductase [Tepidisphaeraceae bacterium]|nr:SDR family oxidoreductase [Tepidisphaeraceae bacterium]
MTGRVALLTGAGRGIGLAIAKAFAAAGCAVAIQDVDAAVADDAAGQIERAGGRAIGLAGDATDHAYAAVCVAEVERQLGGLHVLVNNAAIQDRVDWLEQPPTDLVKILSANVVAPIMFCRAAVPIFLKQHWGRIVNIGSIQGRGGNLGMLPYSLSKATIPKLTKALAREYGREGITVNCIAPGWIASTFRNRNDFANDEEKGQRGKRITVGRVGEPHDLGGTALLLCTAAGEYITGQTIFVDGGISA